MSFLWIAPAFIIIHSGLESDSDLAQTLAYAEQWAADTQTAQLYTNAMKRTFRGVKRISYVEADELRGSYFVFEESC